MGEEIKVNLRSRIQILDITDKEKPKVIISAVIPNEIPAINTTITDNGQKND